jgi:hypothetical protein
MVTSWWEVLIPGLLEWVVAREVAELNDVENVSKELLDEDKVITYVGGFVHVNPNTINVDTIFWAVEGLELGVPISENCKSVST